MWHQRTDSHGNHYNISRRAYGYAPDGRVSWTDREPDGGSSGSSLENGRGDMYWYAPDGSLTNAARNVAAPNGWPARFDALHDGQAPCSASSVSYNGAADSYGSFYNYDAAGNRTNVGQGNPSQQFSYAAGADNEYTAWTYGDNGNTQNPGTGWTYSYDAESHLQGANGPNGQSASFEYDGLGRLCAFSVDGTVVHFYYAGAQRVEERDGSNNVAQNYMYDAPGSDQILLRQGKLGTHYYQYDLLGNTTHLTDAAGNVVEQYLYDCYGAPSVYDAQGNALGGSQYQNRCLFKASAGYYWLNSMQLAYCRARFYLPQHGRWLQPDPIGQAGGLNIYTYCGNDPVNKSDPSGLAVQGAEVNLPLDMAWKMNETGSISGDYSSNGLFATATPTSMAAAGAYSNANGGLASAAPTVRMNEVDVEEPSEEGTEESDPLRGSSHNPEGERAKEKGEDLAQALRNVLDVLKRLFENKSAEAAAAAEAAKAAQADANAEIGKELRESDPRNVLQSSQEANQVTVLSRREAERVTKSMGYKGAEDAKKQNQAVPTSRFDLFRVKGGGIEIRYKDGSGPGEPLHPLW